MSVLNVTSIMISIPFAYTAEGTRISLEKALSLREQENAPELFCNCHEPPVRLYTRKGFGTKASTYSGSRSACFAHYPNVSKSRLVETVRLARRRLTELLQSQGLEARLGHIETSIDENALTEKEWLEYGIQSYNPALHAIDRYDIEVVHVRDRDRDYVIQLLAGTPPTKEYFRFLETCADDKKHKRFVCGDSKEDLDRHVFVSTLLVENQQKGLLQNDREHSPDSGHRFVKAGVWLGDGMLPAYGQALTLFNHEFMQFKQLHLRYDTGHECHYKQSLHERFPYIDRRVFCQEIVVVESFGRILLEPRILPAKTFCFGKDRQENSRMAVADVRNASKTVSGRRKGKIDHRQMPLEF